MCTYDYFTDKNISNSFTFTQLQRFVCLYMANRVTLQWWTGSYTHDSMLLQAVWRQQKHIDGDRNRRIPPCQKMNELNLPDVNPGWHRKVESKSEQLLTTHASQPWPLWMAMIISRQNDCEEKAYIHLN